MNPSLVAIGVALIAPPRDTSAQIFSRWHTGRPNSRTTASANRGKRCPIAQTTCAARVLSSRPMPRSATFPAAVATRTTWCGSTGRRWAGRPRYANAVIPPIECPTNVTIPVTSRATSTSARSSARRSTW
ncbi:hypothetical protein BKN37_11985 [Mycobacterium talmoniae]|uniref:Uncharacterized protein n=1 Tax=Mycobacterium talmoniae TaxID=1858794 RepID=A0A1S1NJ95_9MYCO|nr:hypothetical protein BKN37_11985 [Mycobacterium talmoniae]